MPRRASSKATAISKQDLVDLGAAIIAETKRELGEMRGEMRSEMNGIQDGLRGEMRAMGDALRGEMLTMGDALRGEFRAEIHAFRNEVRDDLRGLGVQIEEIRSIVRATGERQTNMDESIRRLLNERDEQIRIRLDLLEATARAHSGILAVHGAEIAELRQELERLGDAYARRERSPRVLAFEARLARVEAALGIAAP